MKCPYCAEEIQPEAVKCKHCGEWIERKETKTSEPDSKTGSSGCGSGCSPWILLIIIIIAVGYFSSKKDKSSETETGTFYTTNQKDEVLQAVSEFMDSGLIVKMDAKNHKVWVDVDKWGSMSLDEQKNAAEKIAIHCEIRSDVSRKIVVIYDSTDERLIAKYVYSDYTSY